MLRINVCRLAIPLNQPYHLSFAVVNHFDAFLAVLQLENRIAYGECTALPGYSWETPESIWESLGRWLSGAKSSVRKLQACMDADLLKHPFAATPICTALEKLKNPLELVLGSIPLVGIISTMDLKKVGEEALGLIDQGFRTIKIKVKGDPEADLAKVRLIQSVINGKAKLRIDANQGYSPKGIRSFMERVTPDGIELFEQPFKPSAWKEMQELAQMSPLPLMLDESIWIREDIERTAELGCAKYIKLKLAKQSTPRRALELIDLARRAGLGVVFGNGVQSDFGCWDEALIYLHAGLETDGEFNGFLKQQRNLFGKAMIFKNGMLEIVGIPVVDMNAIEKYVIDTVSSEFEWDLGNGE